jgi:hypothetical protein
MQLGCSVIVRPDVLLDPCQQFNRARMPLDALDEKT